MNRIALLIGLIVFSSMVFTLDAAAARHLNVMGSAVIQGNNPADARQNAVDGALAAAVAQVVLDVLDPGVVSQRFQLINEKIIAQRETYIQNYRVVAESVSGNTLRALVQVDITADRLHREMSRLGLMATEGSDSAADTGIDVVVAGTGGHIASFVRLRTAISAMSGVKELKMKELSTDQALLGVSYQGTAQSLAGALRQQTFEGFAIAVDDVTDGTIHLRLLDQ